MCVSGTAIAERMEIHKSDLIKPKLKISVADNSGLQLAGAAFISISGPGGETNQLVYFADNVDDFFISKQAGMDLNIISKEFPATSNQERRTALHPPTSPSGLGNLGGFLSNKGAYSVCSTPSGTNPQLPHVHHQHLDLPSLPAPPGPPGPPGLRQQPDLHPPTNTQVLGNPGGSSGDSGVYAVMPPPGFNHHLPHVPAFNPASGNTQPVRDQPTSSQPSSPRSSSLSSNPPLSARRSQDCQLEGQC